MHDALPLCRGTCTLRDEFGELRRTRSLTCKFECFSSGRQSRRNHFSSWDFDSNHFPICVDTHLISSTVLCRTIGYILRLTPMILEDVFCTKQDLGRSCCCNFFILFLFICKHQPVSSFRGDCKYIYISLSVSLKLLRTKYPSRTKSIRIVQPHPHSEALC
jgi:hypothetical protein